MTLEQYTRKLENYQRSEAPKDVKEKAIAKLKEEFYGLEESKRVAILLDIEASQAEPEKLD